MGGRYTGLWLFGRFSVRASFSIVCCLVEWDSILLHVVEEWSGSNAAIDGFVIFDLGGCKVAVTAISIRSREKVESAEGMGGVDSGRVPEL